MKRYVTDLEEVLIRALADLGIRAARSPVKERVTSVWVGNDKIAAIGVHLSRWVTTHGFALNVTDEPLPLLRGHRAVRDHRRRRHDDRAACSAAALAPRGRRRAPCCRHFGEVFGREIIRP